MRERADPGAEAQTPRPGRDAPRVSDPGEWERRVWTGRRRAGRRTCCSVREGAPAPLSKGGGPAPQALLRGADPVPRVTCWWGIRGRLGKSPHPVMLWGPRLGHVHGATLVGPPKSRPGGGGGSQSHLTQKLVIYAKDTARKWVEKASTPGLMAASADSQFTVLCREKRNGTRCGKEA